MSDLMCVMPAGPCALLHLLSLPSHDRLGFLTQWVCVTLCIRKFHRQLQHATEFAWLPFVCLTCCVYTLQDPVHKGVPEAVATCHRVDLVAFCLSDMMCV